MRRPTFLLAFVFLAALAPRAIAQEDAAPTADAANLDAAPAVVPDAPDAAHGPVAFGAAEAFPLADAVAVTVQAPVGWRGADVDVVIPGLDQVPGADRKVARAWNAPDPAGGLLLLVCATAPSKDWAPGMESMLFDRLNDTANKELGRTLTLSSFTPALQEETASGFQQGFQARGEVGAARKEGAVRVIDPAEAAGPPKSALAITGRHTVAFSASPALVLACSLACAEPRDGASAVCVAALAAHRVEGNTTGEPVASPGARLVSGFARRPVALAGVVAGLVFLLAGFGALLRGLILPSAAPR